jgi:hypothetical protein
VAVDEGRKPDEEARGDAAVRKHGDGGISLVHTQVNVPPTLDAYLANDRTVLFMPLAKLSNAVTGLTSQHVRFQRS